MSVPKGEQKEGKLRIALLTRDLANYTLQITGNGKTFAPEYSGFTERIVSATLRIHIAVFAANEIRVDSSEDYAERKRLQTEAKALCNELLAYIEMAKPLHHLSAKRCRYWCGQVIEIRNGIQRWKESDAKRFGAMT